jgi:hypothetical protein
MSYERVLGKWRFLIFDFRVAIFEWRFENGELASGFKTNRKLQIGNRK